MDNTALTDEVPVSTRNILYKVTILSRTLSVVLFIILPFIGSYIGYQLALVQTHTTENSSTQINQTQNETHSALVINATTPLPPNPNLGTIHSRLVIVNISETASPFTSTDVSTASTSLLRLKQFVKKSSYGKAVISTSISKLYNIQNAACTQSTYQENVNNLIQLSLERADRDYKFPDYSHFIIYHPQPNCPDRIVWTAEGMGTFKEYVLNGRKVHLRGLRTSSISDAILFHEFGHSIGSLPNKNIGHPDYMRCKISKPSSTSTVISINHGCKIEYDFYSGLIPIYDIMSGNQNVGLSDFGAITKLNIGWLDTNNLKKITSNGTYSLSPLENSASGTKVLTLKVTASTTAYFSFRQPIKHSLFSKPGVVVEVISSETFSYPRQSFLVLDPANYQAMMIPGITYTLGSKKITIKPIGSNVVELMVK